MKPTESLPPLGQHIRRYRIETAEVADTYETRRAGFAERCARLAGRTAYREPVGGHATRSDYMPDEHAIAAALAFGRLGRNDIGPDIAVAIATGSPAKRMEIVRELAAALLATTRLADWCSDHLLQVCAESYLSVVGAKPVGSVDGMTALHYDGLRRVGDATLWQAADDAFMRASRAYRRVT